MDRTFSESYMPPKKKPKVEKDPGENKAVVNSPNSHQAQVWLERFKPNTVEDLVVHKKKIEEVESWLVKLRDPGNESRVLLLTGASGSGKLTTTRVLCKKLNYGLNEWANPQDGDDFRSQLGTFAEFIVRATRYRSLLCSENKRIIVVKEIPNVFLRDSSLFHGCLVQYSRVRDLNLVFIISDTLICRDLFPESLKYSTGTTTINFNPVTQRSVTATLQKIAKRAGIMRSLDAEIDRSNESSNGDLRKAITLLQFLSMRPTGELFAVPKPVKKKGQKRINPEIDDDHLDLFRGLGRVLYSKRDDTGRLVHDPETIVGCFDSCANNFVSMLQENYLSIFSRIRDVAAASGYLASSELALNDLKESKNSKNCALSTAVYGTALNNSEPVKKFNRLKKFTNINCLDSRYRSEVAENFSTFGVRDFLVDAKTYLKFLGPTQNQLSLIDRLSFTN